MFMDSESFYYSLTYDLTNSVQRQSAAESDPRPLWQKVPLTSRSSEQGLPSRAVRGPVWLSRELKRVSELCVLWPLPGG